ncbi:MAG: ribonuclease domain-containing protein [Sciscionella sp.]
MRYLTSRTAALLIVFALALLGGASVSTVANAEGAAGVTIPMQAGCGDTSGFTVVELSALPPQAADTVGLIKAGGPFPYPNNDGVVFTNREGILPSCASTYYREYTVVTPGASNRGARRIVTGNGGEYFYTGDHYASFELIDPASLNGGGTGQLPTVGLSTLPQPVRDAVALARSGAQGDEVYQNREGVLPQRSAGYYQLYKVVGSDSERVIAGAQGDIYYTPDHYTSFAGVDLAG